MMGIYYLRGQTIAPSSPSWDPEVLWLQALAMNYSSTTGYRTPPSTLPLGPELRVLTALSFCVVNKSSNKICYPEGQSASVLLWNLEPETLLKLKPWPWLKLHMVSFTAWKRIREPSHSTLGKESRGCCSAAFCRERTWNRLTHYKRLTVLQPESKYTP